MYEKQKKYRDFNGVKVVNFNGLSQQAGINPGKHRPCFWVDRHGTPTWCKQCLSCCLSVEIFQTLWKPFALDS